MNPSPLHVLVLPSFYPSRGQPTLGTFFREQVRALHRSGVRMGTVYAETRSLRGLSVQGLLESHFQTRLENDNGVAVVRMLGWNPLAQTLVGAAVWRWEMLRLVRRYVIQFGPPDILHAHNALWAGLAARSAGIAMKRPYVITEHSSGFLRGRLDRFRQSAAAAAYRNAAMVVCVSRALADAVRRVVPGVSPLVVPNVVDGQFFTLPSGPRKRAPYKFLAVGNLKPDKRFDLLLRAFAAAYAGRSDVRLRIAGSGSDASKLRSLASELRVQTQVEFVGPLSREGVRDAMHAANALVLSSAWETFGVVLVEALATGLPVVATDCGGPSDIVTSDVGLLVPPGNLDALAHAMQAVTMRSWDEDACRRRALEISGNEVVSAMLAGLLQAACADHRRRGDSSWGSV